jgi:hypothetical protein
VIIHAMIESMARRRMERGAASGIPTATDPLRATAAPRRAPSNTHWRFVTIPLRAALLTLIFAGLLANWFEAALLLCVFVLVDLVRQTVSHFAAWTRFVSRIPLLARLAIAAVVSCFVAWFVLKPTWPGDDFTPMIIGLGAALLVFAALLPARGPVPEAQLSVAGSRMVQP